MKKSNFDKLSDYKFSLKEKQFEKIIASYWNGEKEKVKYFYNLLTVDSKKEFKMYLKQTCNEQDVISILFILA